MLKTGRLAHHIVELWQAWSSTAGEGRRDDGELSVFAPSEDGLPAQSPLRSHQAT